MGSELERFCLWCGRGFKIRPAHRSRDPKYCCPSCYMYDRNKNDPGLASRAASKAAEIQKQRRGSGKGYIKEEGRHQHRIVAEKMLGRSLLENEIVHHKDRNKKNNDPSNLEVMTQSEHASLHFKQYWKERRENGKV